MVFPQEIIGPDPVAFSNDPLGYSVLAWYKWGMVCELAGFPTDLAKGPSNSDLKSPVLWYTHAHAMSEAARIVLQCAPNLDVLPIQVRDVCHCQYHAVALMLFGYSLEICLKANLILKKGVDIYQAEERKHFHHRLEKLAEFIPDLSEKDKAILKGLSHFVRWAGRYPDPGENKESLEEIFTIAEGNQISAQDLFDLTKRILEHSSSMIDRNQ